MRYYVEWRRVWDYCGICCLIGWNGYCVEMFSVVVNCRGSWMDWIFYWSSADICSPGRHLWRSKWNLLENFGRIAKFRCLSFRNLLWYTEELILSEIIVTVCGDPWLFFWGILLGMWSVNWLLLFLMLYTIYLQ